MLAVGHDTHVVVEVGNIALVLIAPEVEVERTLAGIDEGVGPDHCVESGLDQPTPGIFVVPPAFNVHIPPRRGRDLELARPPQLPKVCT